MISIHLRRMGAKKDPHYRVVVADSRAARDGVFIEILGHYHPRFEPAKVVLDVDKTKQWIAKGAQPSDTVRSLLRKLEAGIIDVDQGIAPSRQRGAPGHAAEGAAEPKPDGKVEADDSASDQAQAEAAPTEADEAETKTTGEAKTVAASDAAADAEAEATVEEAPDEAAAGEETDSERDKE